MSVQTIAWALEEAPDVPPDLVSLLVGLANHADRDGRHAWPSVPTLADYTRKSERQVQRGLRELQALGLIREGDQRLVLHLRRDRRPTVWDLSTNLRRGDTSDTPVPPMSRGDAHDTPPNGVTHTSRGDTGDANGVTPTSPKPSKEPSKSDLVLEEGDSPAREQARDAADPDRTHEAATPPPAAGRPIPADRKAELERMGEEARAAVAAARAEAAASDRGAIDACQLCDEHGLLPSRVRCGHPAAPPQPGSGRAAFRAERAKLAARTQPCGSCSRSATSCRDRRGHCCPACTHAEPEPYSTEAADALVDDLAHDLGITGPCPTCERTNGHQPGCPDDPATPCPWPTCSLPIGHDQHEHEHDDDDVVYAVIHEATCPGGNCQCAGADTRHDESEDAVLTPDDEEVSGAFGPDDPPF